METVTLVDLAPILGIMVGSMLAFALAIMRYQHVDSIKNRDYVHGLIEKYHREVTSSLSEVRERLAHIEGFLQLWPPPPDRDGNPEAEAA